MKLDSSRALGAVCLNEWMPPIPAYGSAGTSPGGRWLGVYGGFADGLGGGQVGGGSRVQA